VSYDIDNAPLPSHWWRPSPVSADWELIPAVPAPRPQPVWSMTYAEWDAYRAAGSPGSPREWWLARREAEKVAA
jgi:hypothetical protein